MTRTALVLVVAVAACGGDKKSDPPKPSETPPAPAAPAIPAAEIAHAEAERDFGVATLEELARTGPTEARARAIRGLGRTGGERAVKALRELLGDADEAIRVAAIGALSLASAEAAAPDLSARFAEGSAVERRAVVEALGRIGGADQLSVVTAGLGDDDAGVRASAAVALGIYGRRKLALSDGAVEALLRTEDTDAAVRYGRLYAFARQHEPEPDERIDELLLAGLGDENAEHRSAAVVGLARRGAAAAPVFERALADADARVRVQGVRALSGDKATPAMRAALARWVTAQWSEIRGDAAALASPRVEPIVEALEALRPHAKEKPVRDMFRAVAKPEPAKSRWSITPAQQRSLDAVTCLAAAGAGSADDVLACGADGDAWPVHLRRALAAKVARGKTLQTLLRDSDPRVRAAAFETLGAQRKLAGADEKLVLDAFASEAPVEIGTVIDAFGDRFPDAVGERVARELGKAPVDPELVVSLFAALQKSKRVKDASACAAAAGHWNRTVRAAAAECVAALTGEPKAESAAQSPPDKPPVDPADVAGKRVLWTVATSKGAVEIELDPDAAPWNVAVLAMLAKRGFYDGLLWHRVVGDFVVQGGDPSGSGWGGPGYVVPAEPSVPSEGRYDRGAVGIADAGLDTGGCQIFVMHSRAPHLEGRYTRVGRVTKGMEVVDALIVGDAIEKIEVRVVDR